LQIARELFQIGLSIPLWTTGHQKMGPAFKQRVNGTAKSRNFARALKGNFGKSKKKTHVVGT